MGCTFSSVHLCRFQQDLWVLWLIFGGPRKKFGLGVRMSLCFLQKSQKPPKNAQKVSSFKKHTFKLGVLRLYNKEGPCQEKFWSFIYCTLMVTDSFGMAQGGGNFADKKKRFSSTSCVLLVSVCVTTYH
jgi:hypothetical protein